MERIKMIWDFRGPGAKNIAEHHKIHLEEFIAAENLKNAFVTTVDVSDMYSMTQMIVPAENVSTLRTLLKPHRGQRYTET